MRKGREEREEERTGREEAISGACGWEDRRSAAACLLRKAEGSDALSILFLSSHASGGSPCRHGSLIQSPHACSENRAMSPNPTMARL